MNTQDRKEVTLELIERIESGHNDPMVYVPIAMMGETGTPQQEIKRDLTGRDNFLSYKQRLEEAETLVYRTIDRKHVDGLIKSLGWKPNQRIDRSENGTLRGIEVRPGLAMIIAINGRMPTSSTVVRACQQGTATKVSVTRYDPKSKALVTTKEG